jgi:NAD(P)-dependent dehydrogenase (short-subunit alcohol dehydrogenase family)
MADWTTRDIPDQTGKLAVVTGATGGIGLETALGLAAARADVILAARNPDKGHEAEAWIRARAPSAKVRFEPVDLADLSSVKAFADRMVWEGRAIDVLVNNAGVMDLPTRKTTADGHEMQLGVNYLAHFALTAALLPLLQAGRARVVQLSSVAHRGGRIEIDDLNAERGYRPWAVYQQSKLAMLMFAIELQRRSDANRWGLTSVAAHPGVARTDLVANGAGGERPVRTLLTRALIGVMAQSAAAGALPVLMAATLPAPRPGGYYGPQGLGETRGRPGPARIDPAAKDAEVAGRLWEASERLTGVLFD